MLSRLALAAAAAAACTLATSALAAPPRIETVEVDSTRTLPALPFLCPFPIVLRQEGTLQYKTFVDESGATTRQMLTAQSYKVTLTNPATGKSLVSPLGGPVIIEPNDDGTVTVTINGNNGRITIPGEGLDSGALGRLVYIASADAPFVPIEILAASGHQDASPFPGACAGLA